MIWDENQARLSGRHRRGEPVTQVRPRRWDAVNRERAEELDRAEPGWAVWYGVGTRCFHAVARWPTPELLTVQAATAEELDALMREAEQAVSQPARLSGDHSSRLAGGRSSWPTASPVSPSPTDQPTRLPTSRSSHLPGDRSGLTSPPPPPPPPPASVAPPPRGAALMPETSDGLRTACWDLPHDPSVIGKARRAVSETLTTWRLAHLADDLVLVVGELLANAITYGEPPVRLSLWLGGDELCVRVTDHGSDQPRHLDLGVEAVHGRGLTIVEALSDDCGTVPLTDGPGKTVWARWRSAQVPLAVDDGPALPRPRSAGT